MRNVRQEACPQPHEVIVTGLGEWVEVVQHVGDISDLLEPYARRGRIDFLIEDGRLVDFEGDPVLKTLLERVMTVEKITKGKLNFLVRKESKPSEVLDWWHQEGEVFYLYSNKFPTEILPNPGGKFVTKEHRLDLALDSSGEEPKEFWPLPVNTLVRISAGTFHRRSPQALDVEDRYLLRIDPVNYVPPPRKLKKF